MLHVGLFLCNQSSHTTENKASKPYHELPCHQHLCGSVERKEDKGRSHASVVAAVVCKKAHLGLKQHQKVRKSLSIVKLWEGIS